MATLFTDWVKIAQSGATVDGRTINAEWLLQAAESYNPATYTAVIWPDHFHATSYGKVLELKAESADDGVSLFARLEPNTNYLRDNQYGQRLFFSIEIATNFAETGTAYLVGLAVTDSPASLGTEALKFTKDSAGSAAIFCGSQWAGLGQNEAEAAPAPPATPQAIQPSEKNESDSSVLAALCRLFRAHQTQEPTKDATQKELTMTQEDFLDMQQRVTELEATLAGIQERVASYTATTPQTEPSAKPEDKTNGDMNGTMTEQMHTVLQEIVTLSQQVATRIDAMDAKFSAGHGTTIPADNILTEGATTGEIRFGEDELLTIGQQTDLEAVIGECNLKVQLEVARLNAGQNWKACVVPLAANGTWSDAVDMAMELTTVEAIVVTDAVTEATELEAMQAKAESIMATYMRPLFFVACSRAPLATETWSTFTAALNAITAGLACDQVSPVATLWGNEVGAYAGRLANSSVTVADSPMRVATGALVGEWSDRPRDADDRILDMSILDTLDKARWSVPQWYPDYPGVYWGDGNVLDVPGGDYQAIENLRVVQKAMRQVYPLAVARIADRGLNSTPTSIESAKMYFTRPLREMSRSRQILGTVFPGEIEPPKEGDVPMQ